MSAGFRGRPKSSAMCEVQIPSTSPPSGLLPEGHDPDALYFLPLGGSGEIGMNFNLYAHQGQWLIVDCGVTFGEDGSLFVTDDGSNILWRVTYAGNGQRSPAAAARHLDGVDLG